MSSEAWQQRYDAGETGWDRGGPSPALLRWINERALLPCRILVPGCGRGHEVIELTSQGFDVTAIDFAKTPVRELTHRLVESGFVADVMRENVLRFVAAESFDAIYEQTTLCAIDPKHWTSYEQRHFANLRSGGRLFALLMQSNKHDGPPYHCDLTTIKQLFHHDRWEWSSDSFTVDHPSGLQEIATILTKREK